MSEHSKVPATQLSQDVIVHKEQSMGLIARGFEAVALRNKRDMWLRTAPDLQISPIEMIEKLDYYIRESSKKLTIEVGNFYSYDQLSVYATFDIKEMLAMLSDVHVDSDHEYYAKLGSDHEELIGSIHNGYYFNFFARVGGEEVDLLNALRFTQSKDGIISAFFVNALLPVAGAFWHGRYYIDAIDMIETDDERTEILSEGTFDLIESTLDEEAVKTTLLGLRVNNSYNELQCACLCVSDNYSVVDFNFAMDKNNYVVKRPLKKLISTSRVLY